MTITTRSKSPSLKKICLACGALFAVGTWFPQAYADSAFSFASTPGRLPKDVIPLTYHVHLIPNIEQHTLDGEESIELEVLQPTQRIVLNAVDIKLDSAKLSGNGIATQTLVPKLNAEQQTLSFELGKVIPSGRYTLAFRYSGLINREAQGLYFDKYKIGQQEKQLIGTQMEANEARRMLPCWDEPAFRASFQMSVDLPANFNAYSNTPITSHTSLSPVLQRVEFAPTPKMASYLIVLVAGELERSAHTQNGVETGVVTVQGKLAQAKFALDAGQQVLAYYNDYFGIAFPLTKLDHVAVPGGFGGAMENWGGIVYNESTLLIDPEHATQASKMQSFGVLAHETAHQWFGDLVTMAWWDNLWLNEGFANWMESKATNHFHPEWHIYETEHAMPERAMALDASKQSHPIHQAITNEAQANDSFDEITYDKTGAFLRMLESYLGEDVFRTGIQHYMAKHKYSNTTSVDLWSELDLASGQPVSKIAHDWTEVAGFPLIKVDAQCSKGIRTISLQQEPYTLDKHAVGNALWTIPVQIGTINGKPDYVLMQDKNLTVTRSGCDKPLVIDQDAVGYFRVQYAPALQAAIAADFSKQPTSTRLKVLADTWSLSSSDRIPLADYLSLFNALGAEDNPAVWGKMIASIRTLDRYAQDNPLRDQWRAFVRPKLAAKFAQLGWEEAKGDSPDVTRLRARLIATLGRLGDADIIAEAKKRFADIAAGKSKLSHEVDDVITFLAGRNADPAIYETLWKLAQTAPTATAKEQYFNSMLSAQDPALAKRSLALAIDSKLPPLESSRVLFILADNEHLELSWDFAMKHADQLTKMQPAYEVNRFYPSIVRSAIDEQYAEKLDAFAKANLPESLNEANRTSEAIRIHAREKGLLVPQLEQLLNRSHM